MFFTSTHSSGCLFLLRRAAFRHLSRLPRRGERKANQSERRKAAAPPVALRSSASADMFFTSTHSSGCLFLLRRAAFRHLSRLPRRGERKANQSERRKAAAPPVALRSSASADMFFTSTHSSGCLFFLRVSRNGFVLRRTGISDTIKNIPLRANKCG